MRIMIHNIKVANIFNKGAWPMLTVPNTGLPSARRRVKEPHVTVARRVEEPLVLLLLWFSGGIKSHWNVFLHRRAWA